MYQTKHGFTIVELLLVIAVGGILTTIAIMGWSNVALTSRDRARAQDVQAWASTFELYRSKYKVYPVIPSTFGASATQNTYCLGDFSDYNNRCVQYTSAINPRSIDSNDARTTSILTEVQKVGNVPVNSGPAIADKLVGPILYIQKDNGPGSSIQVTAKFIDFFENTSQCPSGLVEDTDSVPINSLLASLSGVNFKACKIQKQFTYDPNN